MLLGSVTIIAYGINYEINYAIIGGAFLTLIVFFNLYKFVTKRFIEIDDFFEYLTHFNVACGHDFANFGQKIPSFYQK